MDLVLDNLNLVKKIAHKFARSTFVEYDDLFQEGCIGLMRAADKYVQGDVPFGAFAGKHIQWEILRLLKTASPISEKTHIRVIATMIHKRGLTDAPTSEIAKVIDYPLSYIENAVAYSKAKVFSLDKQLHVDKTGADAYDFYNTFKYEQDFETSILFEQALATISEIYREPLRLYLKGFTNEQIAVKLGITLKQAKNRVRTGKARIRANKEEILDEIYSI